MASIFTYDPDPPKVSSPWLVPADPSSRNSTPHHEDDLGKGSTTSGLLSDYGVTKLQAEPQEGPTEYKLHLLLRPRRAYKSMTTTKKTNCSYQTKEARTSAQGSGTLNTSQPRQQRLLHLTTQLLWRLQQSSPYHASSSREIPLPQLPEDNVDLDSLKEPEGLIPGLEESRGALYEIGVSDDGTLVGLTLEEMNESLKTLQVMAASLGCSIEVLRRVIVGDCEWIETCDTCPAEPGYPQVTRQAKLWVAEALVTPNLGMKRQTGHQSTQNTGALSTTTSAASSHALVPSKGSSQTPQLRVTFTGPTTSGKSSLLGTLSTGQKDNGRGQSRINLLKHRHEVASGVTSSIAQELIGYKDLSILTSGQRNKSWLDVHDFAEGGRLVFVSDSGGHPRYRRTVLRGLMNWAPHWSVLCVAADDTESRSHQPGATTSAREVLGAAAAAVDLTLAHLTLSLKLNVPMVVVVTKLDLASQASVQKTVTKILSTVKAAGRTPKILHSGQKGHEDLLRIPPEDVDKAGKVLSEIIRGGNLTHIVPIVLTSAVNGSGIGLLHALLKGLPLPPAPTAADFIGSALNPEQPKVLFHVDDTFGLPASYSVSAKLSTGQGTVVSGHLRFGNMAIGDKILVGPFPPEEDESGNLAAEDKASPGNYGLSVSHPSSAELAKVAMKHAVSASSIEGEWHTAYVVSIRNLRLPVRSLEAGQAGTIGLVFESKASQGEVQLAGSRQSPRIRRGMVLAIPSKHMEDTGLSLQAASGFTATFHDADIGDLAVGSFVNAYTASVRATARVRGISHHRPAVSNQRCSGDPENVFTLNEEMECDDDGQASREMSTQIFLEILNTREWIELGSPVILLEGGTRDKSGLEGFVGKVIEIIE